MYPTHSPKLPRRSDQNYVGQTQPSSRSSPVTLPRASKMASPGRARKAQQQRGVDNNGAALTLENLQSVNAAYSQTFLTEGRERAPSPPRPANLSARSASLTNVRGRSWDRGDAYDYAPAPHAGERYPPLQRGRSLERAEYGGGLRGNERWYLDPHDYDIERPHSQASSYSDRYAYRDGGGAQQLNSQLILDLQAQICDLQRECSGLHQDLDQSNQKLSSSMNSIKTFWSPELKKERAMRKEENLKYAMQQEQLRLSMHENEKHISTLNQLQEELRTQHRLNRHLAENVGDPGRSMAALANLDTLRTEHASQSKAMFLQRETIKEMEMRIDTQRQTLAARDDSIKKLLEMLQSKGLSSASLEAEVLELERVKTRIIEADTKAKHLELYITQKDAEIFALKEDLSRAKENLSRFEVDESPSSNTLQAIIETKDSHIRTLEREVKLLQDQVTRGRADVAAAAAGSVYDLSSGVMLEGERPQPDGISMREVDELRTHERALKFRLDELRADISKRDSQLLAARTHMETLKKQQSDYQHHIVVLKESLSAKEQHTSMLQTDLETLRMKLEEKNAIIEQKTQQTLAATSERNRLAGELHELRDHMDIKERKINVLQRKIENLEDLISEKDKQLDGVKSKLSLQLDQSSDSVVASLEDAVRDKEQQIDRLKAQRERLERERMDELEAHQGALRDQRDRAEQLQAQIDEYDVQVDELKLELDSANKENIEKSTKILQLESEITQLKDRSMKLEIDLVKAQEQTLQSEQTQTNSVNEEAAHLQDRIENLEDKIGHYIGQVDKSQNEVDRLLDILKEMEEEKNEKEKQLQSLQEQVTEQTKKLGMQKREQKRSVQLLDEAKKREGDMKQNGVDMQTTLKHRNERVEELEEALRESVKITAEREVAIAEYRNKLRDVEMQLEDMRKQLEEANDAKKSKDDRLQTLRAERHRQLAELSEMKQEALRAAISEKDANIALLEMASPNPNHPRAIEDIKRLRKERDDLKKKLKEESERGMRLMSEFKEHEKQTLATPSGPAGEGKTPDGEEEEGIWA